MCVWTVSTPSFIPDVFLVYTWQGRHSVLTWIELTMILSRSLKIHRRALILSAFLSFRRLMLRCPWPCSGRQCLRLLNTSSQIFRDVCHLLWRCDSTTTTTTTTRTMSPSRVLPTQKVKIHLLKTQRLKVLSLKPGAGQNIAMQASPSARDFFHELISSLPVHSTALFFSKPFPSFSCVSCVDSQYKIGHHAPRHWR